MYHYYCDRLELESDPSDTDEIDWKVFDLLYPDEFPMHPIIYQETVFPPETDIYFYHEDLDGLRLSLLSDANLNKMKLRIENFEDRFTRVEDEYFPI